jgi:hypothetical protein
MYRCWILGTPCQRGGERWAIFLAGVSYSVLVAAAGGVDAAASAASAVPTVASPTASTPPTVAAVHASRRCSPVTGLMTAGNDGLPFMMMTSPQSLVGRLGTRSAGQPVVGQHRVAQSAMGRGTAAPGRPGERKTGGDGLRPSPTQRASSSELVDVAAAGGVSGRHAEEPGIANDLSQ